MTQTDARTSDSSSEPVEHPTGDRAPVTAGRAIGTMLLTFIVAMLLCAPSLERVAERQGFGRGRDVAIELVRPVSWLSHALFLDRPRDWIASLTGHEDPPTSGLLVARAQVERVTVPTTTPTTVGSAPTVPTTTTTLPPHRVPTPDAPLKVWMGGDSLMGTVSEGFARAIGGDPRVSIYTDVQVATGLARPDVLDWAGEFTNQLNGIGPEVVIFAFGANDDQPMVTPDDQLVKLYTPEWKAEYARRAALMMDLASANGTRTVIWLGLPAERPEQLNNVKDDMNEVTRAQAALRVDVHFLDLQPLFDAPVGTYADEITLADGSVVDTRARDGVHLSEDGADLLAPRLVDLIATPWHLR